MWLELDAFLRSVAARNGGAMPAPAQLLSLLPPLVAAAAAAESEPAEGSTGASGWPADFLLHRVAASLAQQVDSQQSVAAAAGLVRPEEPEPYIPCDHALYPARRRAQRLSFSVWALIRQENSDLQPVLEATSTSERLRLAADRLREMRERM